MHIQGTSLEGLLARPYGRERNLLGGVVCKFTGVMASGRALDGVFIWPRVLGRELDLFCVLVFESTAYSFCWFHQVLVVKDECVYVCACVCAWESMAVDYMQVAGMRSVFLDFYGILRRAVAYAHGLAMIAVRGSRAGLRVRVDKQVHMTCAYVCEYVHVCVCVYADVICRL